MIRIPTLNSICRGSSPGWGISSSFMVSSLGGLILPSVDDWFPSVSVGITLLLLLVILEQTSSSSLIRLSSGIDPFDLGFVNAFFSRVWALRRGRGTNLGGSLLVISKERKESIKEFNAASVKTYLEVFSFWASLTKGSYFLCQWNKSAGKNRQILPMCYC